MQAKRSRQERNPRLVAEIFTVSEAASEKVCKFCHVVRKAGSYQQPEVNHFVPPGKWITEPTVAPS